MPTALLTVLAVLATYRLTRLVTADRITQALRARIVSRNRTLGYLVTCDWCLSIWVAPLPAAGAVLYPENRLVWIVLLGLSASAVTGLLSLGEARLDQE